MGGAYRQQVSGYPGSANFPVCAARRRLSLAGTAGLRGRSDRVEPSQEVSDAAGLPGPWRLALGAAPVERDASGQVTLVEFYADWCVSCKVIETEVFGDPRVQRSLAGVLLLRADVTANDARHRELMRTHQVIGPPTVMMFDTEGRERREARLVGEFTARQFLQRQTGQATLNVEETT